MQEKNKTYPQWCMRRGNDCRTTESEQYNFFRNNNLRWCNKYDIGSVWQKYFSSLTLSFQQHEKYAWNSYATEISCILISSSASQVSLDGPSTIKFPEPEPWSTGGASLSRDRLCGTVFRLFSGDRRWHCTLSSDNSRPICSTSDVSTNRRNIHHWPALLWCFSWFWRRI